jgi:hypothetical protein
MEEEDRQSKLKAGKDALLAFQKKKNKRKPKLNNGLMTPDNNSLIGNNTMSNVDSDTSLDSTFNTVS